MTTPTFSDARPRLGEAKTDLETPVVVADRDGVERNVHRYADLAEEHDVDLRVHTKAHKIPELARWQMDVRPDGVLCQKLGEAEVMVRDGIDDVLLVCPVVTESKLERVVWLAEKCEQFAMMVDGPGNVEPLAAVAAAHDTTVDVVIEIDAGLRRMGVRPGDEAVAFAEHVAGLEGVSIHGILGHDAHLPFVAEDETHLAELCADTAGDLGSTADRIESEVGVADLAVTSGASATAPYMAEQDAITELDPGRYVFNDVDSLVRAPHVEKADCALTVVTTVIAKPTEDRAICDAGSKTISYNTDAPDPVPVGRDDVGFPGRSSEHGHLDVSEADDVEVGDRLEFVVPNAYGPINIHETIPAVSDGEVRELWTVEARGKDK
jgi:D-serine deaminase-like pyridoxal phosphate-dependent protein